MKYSECKRRILIIRKLGFETCQVKTECLGFIKFIKIDGIHGGMRVSWEEVTDERIRYFEQYITACTKYYEKKIKQDFVHRSLYGKGGLDD